MRKFFDWLFNPYTPVFYPAVFYLGVVGALFMALVVAFIISPLMLGAALFVLCFGAPVVGYFLRRKE